MSQPIRILYLGNRDAALMDSLSQPDILAEHASSPETLESFLPGYPADIFIIQYESQNYKPVEIQQAVRMRLPNCQIICFCRNPKTEILVEAIRNGANDVIVADQLSEVPGILERAAATVRRNALQKDQEQRIRLLEQSFENMQLGITLTDLQGKIVYTNTAEAHMHGYGVSDLIGRDSKIFAPRDLWRSMTSDQVREIHSWKRESINIRADGTVFPVQIISDILTDPSGSPCGMVTICEDISERNSSSAAFYDLLTGLPNRALAMDRLSRSVKRIKRRPDYLFAVLVLDLDLFHKVNERFGTGIGDHLLSAAARRIESCIRFGDTVGRMGGDEFFVLLEDLREIADATFIADRILHQLAAPFTLDGQEVLVTASIGIAPCIAGYDRQEDILRDADTAMFRAKAMGRDRHQVFDHTMQTRAMALLPLESALRHALQNQELQLEYQPVFSLETGKIESCEAMVRWHHPQRGIVFSEEFLPVAEETGLLDELVTWILYTSLKTLQPWMTPGFFISLKMRESHLRQQTLAESIRRVCKEQGYEPGVLQLEFSERHLQAHVEVAIRQLEELKKTGVRLSLCDFGTGQSSLISLQKFHIDSLKMDRSFLRDMILDSKNESAVASVITLAHSLQMNVVADGVETEDQLAMLKWHHCDQAQGRFLCEPVSAGKFGELLTKDHKIV